MAIYKLGELYSDDPQYGINEKALDSGRYHYVRQSDIRNSSFDKYVNSGPLLKENDVLISRVGANAGDTYIHKLRGNYVYAGYLVRYKFNKKILLDEYFYYWTKTTLYQRQLKSLRTGAAQPQFNPPMVGNIQINVPPIQEQQKIIDIIEPVERMINSLNSSKERVISLISKIGELSIFPTNSSIKFEKQKEKYIESGNYVSTGSIGDFNNVIEKIEELTLTPTRARIQFKKDTLYISKLDGEKKILYLNKDQDLILSNGMWGIEGDENSKYSLYGVLMSDTFYEEKKMKSTGTTMRGLNDKTLNQIINSYSISTVYNGLLQELFFLLSELTIFLDWLLKIKVLFIKLLIQ